jgi:hypothetical protein
VRVALYPIEASDDAHLVSGVGAFTGFFDAGYCDEVRRQAQLVQAGGADAPSATRFVRHDGDAPIHIPLSPLVGSGFASAASDGPPKAGATDDNDFVVGIGAKDLLCDLKEGRASLQLDLSGNVGEDDWTGKTFIAGVTKY